MNIQSGHSQQSNEDIQKKNRSFGVLVLCIVILCITAVWFWAVRLSSKSVIETSPEAQAVIFLRKQVSEMTEDLLRDFSEEAILIKLAVEFEWKNNNPSKAMMLREQGL